MNHLNHAIEEFAKTANNQENKGITKYGKPLNPYDNYDWLDMEFEELVDAAKYNRAEKKGNATLLLIEYVKSSSKNASLIRKSK